MNHSRRLLVLAAAVVGAAGMASAGWAYWSASGSGSASATVGTLDAPTAVTVPEGPIASPVPVSWTAPAGGISPSSYQVARSVDGTAWIPACAGPVSTMGCSDEDVADGTYIYRVTAIFESWTAQSAPSGSVTVSNIGPASQIVLSGSTADLVSGTTRVLTATIQDAAGRTITSGAESSHRIMFSRSAGPGSVSGLGPVDAVDGVATITVTGNLAGPVTTQAAATFAGGAVTSNNLGFGVVHGAATQLALSGSTGDLASGVTRVLTATVRDVAGNTVTTGADAARSVTFSQTGGTGSLGGIAGGIPATGGVATITVTGYAAGPVTTQASTTLGAPGLTYSTTLSFDVTVGAATHLAFTNQPGNSTGGIPSSVQPAVTVRDFGGNTVTTDTGSITLAIGTNPAGGTLSGTATLNALDGVATFSGLSIDKTGTGYTLTASRSGLSTGTSSPFDIAVGPAAQLAFSTQPSTTATGGTAFATQPQVTVMDAGGNRVAASFVVLAVTTGSGGGAGGTLACATNPVASNSSGVAVFAGCSIDTRSSNPYTLTATSGTATATSTGITVSAGPAAGITITNASNKNGSITPMCTGTVGSLRCDALGGTSGNNRFFRANVTLIDRGRNIVSNSSGATIAVNVTGSNITSGASLQIANSASSTSGQFNIGLSNGSHSGSYTATATVGGATVNVSGTVS